MKNLRKLSREEKKKFFAGDNTPAYCFDGGGPGEGGCGPSQICSNGQCVTYTGSGGGSGNSGGTGGGASYTCICPWGTVIQSEPCAGPPYYCIQG